jgi:hypothetical protein
MNSVPSYAAKDAQNSGPLCDTMAQHGTIGIITKDLSTGVGSAFHPLFAGGWHVLTQGGMGWHTKKKWRPQGDLNPCRRRERAVSDRTNILIYNNL